MNHQSIDLSNFGKNTNKSIGYDDSSFNQKRNVWIQPNISINSNIIIFISIIFSIIIFISQFCLNNFGINSNNICQKSFINIYTQYYYIVIPFFIILFIYYFGIYDYTIDFFKREYYDYKNNYPNIFSTVLNYNYSFGSINIFICYLKTLINFDNIKTLLNKKKEYEII